MVPMGRRGGESRGNCGSSPPNTYTLVVSANMYNYYIYLQGSVIMPTTNIALLTLIPYTENCTHSAH